MQLPITPSGPEPPQPRVAVSSFSWLPLTPLFYTSTATYQQSWSSLAPKYSLTVLPLLSLSTRQPGAGSGTSHLDPSLQEPPPGCLASALASREPALNTVANQTISLLYLKLPTALISLGVEPKSSQGSRGPPGCPPPSHLLLLPPHSLIAVPQTRQTSSCLRAFPLVGLTAQRPFSTD